MSGNWIRLYRTLRDTPYYTESKAVHVWVECLLRASYKEREKYLKRQKVVLEAGQFVMGRDEFGKCIGMSGSTVWYWINQFEADNMIDIKKTAKGSLVTIKNWEKYQGVDSTSDNGKTTKKQQKNTNKKVNKEKKEKNVNIILHSDSQSLTQKGRVVNELIDLFAPVNPEYKRFFKLKTQRRALSELIDNHGADKVKAWISGLEWLQSQMYAPVITTPLQLQSKLGEYQSFVKKEQGGRVIVID